MPGTDVERCKLESDGGTGHVAPVRGALSDPLGGDHLGVDPLVQPGPELAPEEPDGADAEPGRLARTGHAITSGAKRAGTAIKTGAVHTGHAIAHGAEVTGHAIAHGASVVGHAVEEGAHVAWEGTKAAGRAVKRGAIKAWDGTKAVGASAGHGAKHGGLTGGLLGGMGGAAVGGGVGALATAPMAGFGAKKAGMIGGGVLAVGGGVVGGLLGGIGGLVKGGIDELRTDEGELLEKTSSIPAYHVIVEQLAHHYAYGRGDLRQLEGWGYALSGEHVDATSGFRVVAFSPTSPDARTPDGEVLPPVVAFHGTANLGGAKDDANDQGVGTFQFARNEREIEQVIGLAEGTSKPDVTGHSLGGALAQLAAARFGSQVGNVITFQSPGINADEVAKIDAREHTATHYRVKGDVVPDAGEAFAPGELFDFAHKGPGSPLAHLSFPLAELNAIRQKHGLDVPIVDGTRSQIDRWQSDGADHEGAWGTEESKVPDSRLMDSRHHDDVMTGKTSFLADAGVLGKKRAGTEPLRQLVGKASGLSGRQAAYAAAWKEIRALCLTVLRPEEVEGVRARVVDLLIGHEVSVEDHSRFISQAEAAMLTALEASPYHVGEPIPA